MQLGSKPRVAGPADTVSPAAFRRKVVRQASAAQPLKRGLPCRHTVRISIDSGKESWRQFPARSILERNAGPGCTRLLRAIHLPMLQNPDLSHDNIRDAFAVLALLTQNSNGDQSINGPQPCPLATSRIISRRLTVDLLWLQRASAVAETDSIVDM